MNNNTENAPVIPNNENDVINIKENNQNKIEPKSNLIFSENDVQISRFNNNGNIIVENKNNRSLLNSEKNKKQNRFINNEWIYNNTYDKNLFNKLGNDINDIIIVLNTIIYHLKIQIKIQIWNKVIIIK